MRRALSALASCLAIATSADAQAGGLYFSDRGVRPMGRAGAYVAGADDLGAIWYNPAGLADAKTSVLADFAILRFSSQYTRSLRVVDADLRARAGTSGHERRGAGVGKSHNLVVVGSSPTRPTEKARCFATGFRPWSRAACAPSCPVNPPHYCTPIARPDSLGGEGTLAGWL